MELNLALLYTASDQGKSLNYPHWDLAETYIKHHGPLCAFHKKHLILYALTENGWI